MIEEIKMYQAVCDRCGYVCDEDEGEIEIRDTPDEMKHEAENYGWRKSMADFEIVGLVESPIVWFIPAKL